MTENEAIEILSNELMVITDIIRYCKDFEKESDFELAYRIKNAHNIAISALEEIQQYREIGTVKNLKLLCSLFWLVGFQELAEYRQIGTVEVCKKAVEKQKQKALCDSAEKYSDGKCVGYGKSETDDEPCEMCKRCNLYTGHEELESEEKTATR